MLDAGRGTSEHALYFAHEGYTVLSRDTSRLAIKKAQEKAAERGLKLMFQVADALELYELKTTFDTVTDCGLLHTFSDEERAQFVEDLKSVLKPGGTYFLWYFSNQLASGFGLQDISQAEIYQTFKDGWRVNSLETTSFELSIASEKQWSRETTISCKPLLRPTNNKSLSYEQRKWFLE